MALIVYFLSPVFIKQEDHAVFLSSMIEITTVLNIEKNKLKEISIWFLLFFFFHLLLISGNRKKNDDMLTFFHGES